LPLKSSRPSPPTTAAPSRSPCRIPVASLHPISLPSLSRRPPLSLRSSTAAASTEIAGASLIRGFHPEKVCRSEKVWRLERRGC
ncbi:unnamed protein product, partial [Linum tenue]